LQRWRQANKLELISVWSSPSAFDDHLAEAGQQEVRRALEDELLAPVDDRRCTLIAGAWSTD
jgi:quinol monooxygenase YgiN